MIEGIRGLDIGSVIGQKYLLTRVIGRGGMGTVFEASHVSTGERVAVKVLLASKSQEGDAQKVVRFEREAIAIGKLDTPHVVSVFDAGVDAPTGQPYIAMEILHGEDLSQLLRQNGPLPAEAALAIVAQACAGLYKAHEAGIVHRDIKPGNLFLALTPTGERIVKLLDFGIAKVRKIDDAISSELGTITETGTLVGSPYYMSPEQAKGLKTVDHRADIWSLGVVLYKCLTGRTPFDGHSTLGQVIIAVCGEDAPSVQFHAPWVPDEVARIIERALQRNVATRFQNAYEMYEAIRPLLVDGGRITEGHLTPLSPELRAQLSPAPSVSSGMITPPSSSASPVFSHTPAAPVATSMPVPVYSGATPRRSRGLTFAIVAFAVLAVGTFTGGLFVKLTSKTPIVMASPPPSPSPTPSPSATMAEAPSVASSIAVDVSSTALPTSVPVASAKTAQTKPAVKPASHPTGKPAGPSGPGRLQGGVGSDVPF